MRRSEKEIKDIKIIYKILNEADVCRVGFSKANKPYVVPMNFGFDESHIYLHSSVEGKKMEILKENKNICFEVDVKSEIVKSEKPCNWGMHYMSVMGFGTAELIEEPEEKIRALDIIMDKYDPEGLNSYEYLESSLKRTAVIKLNITELTAKKS
ncbi:pyridoxamine 5'-phosphate oxidase-related FMN-binding protein [Methanobacterium lacus]|uniref:Pyridoxamine 5'-phosphate oxidase-related FMN-binding protein n=1 Tax=Methanobacterium lacus (strain AL-21) TaxID=877455 RepID=F0T9Q2_METLA|nr:pyridoxamine 5'-phosphate oxidase family protein [Methanobacterium lacus]ADZ09931.1 pyridoxamine 5'-phosphate oxidase-related FMN-binding protein [Methanobacterium lacus]